MGAPVPSLGPGKPQIYAVKIPAAAESVVSFHFAHIAQSNPAQYQNLDPCNDRATTPRWDHAA